MTEAKEVDGYSPERVNSRNNEIKSIQNELKAEVFNLSFTPASLTDRDIPALVTLISKLFQEIEPNIVYLPNRSDAHSDHGVSFKAAFSCTKVFRYPSIKTVLMYETISETDFAPALPEAMFLPNYFVDISDFLAMKLDLLGIYASELADHPFPRSIQGVKALATVRGAASGVKSAEAFQLLKQIK